MELTEDDVLQILKLIDESHFDYFQLEVGELKITVSKGDPIPVAAAPQAGAAPAVATPAPKPAVAPAPPAAAPQSAESVTVPEGMLAITAPLLGTFYVAPEPGNTSTRWFAVSATNISFPVATALVGDRKLVPLGSVPPRWRR